LLFGSLLAALSLAALGFALWVTSSDLTAEDKALTEHILEGQGALVSASSIYPKDWDHVCYLDPYSFPSVWIPKSLPEITPKLTFVPADRWVDEERFALVFVSAKRSEARVFLIDNQVIYRIEGPRCMARELAAFRTDIVEAP